MSSANLRRIGALLFGPQWQHVLSRFLDVDTRLVRRWAGGQNPVPQWAMEKLESLATAFPIVLDDPPGADSEGRLLIYLRTGEMLASLPFADVDAALGSLKLDGTARGGVAVLQALREAVRTRCRGAALCFIESDPWAGPSQAEVDAVVRRMAADAEE